MPSSNPDADCGLVCADGGAGEEESASVCDLPGADCQDDQQRGAGAVCRAVQPQREGDVSFRVQQSANYAAEADSAEPQIHFTVTLITVVSAAASVNHSWEQVTD